jgi:tetraacyldisaccharide 4'-kinase
MFRAGLWLPGKAYGAFMRARSLAYRRSWLPIAHLPVPTLSVGNLTAGGTGKTPFASLLARELSSLGRRPGILLRGYRRDAGCRSDEEELHRRLCPAAIVKADPDRLRSAQAAVEEGARVLILDDGFQRLSLARDLDFVLVDATSPWGGGNCLPGGLLREPKPALARAGLVVITRSDQADAESLSALAGEIARLAPKASVFRARHRPARLRRLDGSRLELDELRGREVAALCGIARPEAFRRTLESLGARVVHSVAGRDHAGFGAGFLVQALNQAASRKIPLMVTEKDAAGQAFSSLGREEGARNLWILGIDLELDDQASLRELLRGLPN